MLVVLWHGAVFLPSIYSSRMADRYRFLQLFLWPEGCGAFAWRQDWLNRNVSAREWMKECEGSCMSFGQPLPHLLPIPLIQVRRDPRRESLLNTIQ